MSETLITWPDACVFCGDSNGTIGRTANDHWKQFKCGTEYEVVGEKTAWIQDDDCKIAALMEELAAEKQQRQAAEEETKRWMELAEHQAIGRDKLGTDLAAANSEVDRLRKRDQQWQEEAFISLAHCEAVGADKAAAVMRTLLLRMGIEEPSDAK